jgi:hypothetical protein
MPAVASSLRSGWGLFVSWDLLQRRKRGPGETDQPPSTVAGLKAGVNPLAQTRIIIVDDDSLIRMDLRDLLQRMG